VDAERLRGRSAHDLVHQPHCPTCRVCVMARGRDDPHSGRTTVERGTEEVDRTPVVEMDYTMLGEQRTVLSLYVKPLHGGNATAVERKGVWPFAVAWVRRCLDVFGLSAICLRTDREDAMLALAAAVKQARSKETQLESVPIASHQGIGGVERYHCMLQDEVRALRLDAEAALDINIPADGAAATWLIRHAAWILNRFALNREQHSTFYYRLKGRSYRGPLVKIFEAVVARRPQDVQCGRKTSKWDSRWYDGLWLGRSDASEEHLIYVAGEVQAVRALRRYAETDPRRWRPDEVLGLRAVPWKLREDAVGEPFQQEVCFGPRVRPLAVGIQPMRNRPLTPGCKACSCRGMPSHGYHHTVECRRRCLVWLNSQLGSPAVEAVPEVRAEELAEVPRAVCRRVVGKTTPEQAPEGLKFLSHDLMPNSLPEEMMYLVMQMRERACRQMF